MGSKFKSFSNQWWHWTNLSSCFFKGNDRIQDFWVTTLVTHRHSHRLTGTGLFRLWSSRRSRCSCPCPCGWPSRSTWWWRVRASASAEKKQQTLFFPETSFRVLQKCRKSCHFKIDARCRHTAGMLSIVSSSSEILSVADFYLRFQASNNVNDEVRELQHRCRGHIIFSKNVSLVLFFFTVFWRKA